MAVKAHCMAVARDPNTGATLTSATVNVYNPGTVTPISATIFDKNGVTLSNPLTSDSVTGLIDFYLSVAQEVDLVVAKASYTTRTYSNVPVIDDASLDLTALLTTTGDMAYASSANTPARLAAAANNSIMYVASGVPAWNTNFQVNSSGNVGISTGPATNFGLSVDSSLTSSGGSAASIQVSGGTLTSAQNSDQLNILGFSNVVMNGTSHSGSQFCSIRIATPTINNASASAYAGLLIDACGQVAGTESDGIRINAVTGANSINYGLYIAAPSGGTTNEALHIAGGGFNVAGTYNFANAEVAVGGGATATLSTIGGSGPATAAQHGWLQIQVAGTNSWVPVWR